ncbi:MAG: RES family NAD+ phosphorylase [Burkholderiales bacterium]|nr:RES family NAD+ phosphorylase [Burkholderiales bacterium]
MSTFATEALRARVWRAVEAQHQVATMKLVGHSLTDQKILEDILEDSKPPVPEAARGKHWLIFTPFRYRPQPPGSRFRAPNDPGVFYAAFERRTACAEIGYWRWRFVQDSEGLEALEARPMSLFAADLRTAAAIDLRKPPLARKRKTWTDPGNYAETQALARQAREQDVETIVYESVRDPQHGGAVAVLMPKPLSGPVGTTESWFLTIVRDRAIWQRGLGEAFEFGFGPGA